MNNRPRVYLDNCCFNRPFDDQSHLTIHLETRAKLMIQDLIKDERLELIGSFILDYENHANRFITVDKGILTKSNAVQRVVVCDPIKYIAELEDQ